MTKKQPDLTKAPRLVIDFLKERKLTLESESADITDRINNLKARQACISGELEGIYETISGLCRQFNMGE